MTPTSADRNTSTAETRGVEPKYGIAPPTHRLPATARVGSVRLQVADLERSLPYYQSVLGLNTLERGRASATLGAQDSSIPLVALEERRGATPAPLRGRLGLYHFAILLPHRLALGAFVEHLRRSGVRGVGSSDHLVSEALYLRDPDGLGIEVYADRPRDAWRVHSTPGGPELAMGTEPLDVEALVEAGKANRGPACRPAPPWDIYTCTWEIWIRRQRFITGLWGWI